jgi:cysteine-rich repeat protein
MKRRLRRVLWIAAVCGALGVGAAAGHACANAGDEPRCGDGRIDPGESCDDGNTTDDDDCTGLCTVSMCGDRIVNESAEQCDDGNTGEGDGCTRDCIREGAVCGNGTLEVAIRYPEECDDGNTAPHDGCSERCFREIPRCGDGWVYPGLEQCDDGNRVPYDGCDQNCRWESGDGGDAADRADDAGGDRTDVPDDGADLVDGEFSDVQPETDGDAGDVGDVSDIPEGWDCTATPPGCDLVPQCGCGDGQKCTLMGEVPACTPSGFLSEGAACTADVECAQGTMCVPGIGSDVTMCYRFCAGEDDCFGPGSLCVVTVISGGTTVPGATLCSVNCNPVSSSGCPSGTGCKLWQESGGAHRWLTDCSGAVGTGRGGTPCADDYYCAPGFFCAIDAGLAECLEFCEYPSGYCDGGYTCTRFTTPIRVGTVEYGYCY